MATAAPLTYLDTAEVANKIKRSPQTVRRFVRLQGFPSHRVNGRLMFIEAEVDAWLTARAAAEAKAEPGDHRAEILRLVAAAPELTAQQAQRIRAALGVT